MRGKQAVPKPTLVKIGEHYVDPKDVSGFKRAKKGLYILLLKSEPEPQFPLWVSYSELVDALEYFDVQGVPDEN